MPNIELRFLANDPSAVQMAQRLRVALNEAEAAGVKLGSSGRQATGQLKGGLDQAAESVAGLVKGFLGFEGVRRLLGEVFDDLNRLRQLNEELSEKTISTQTRLLAMAQQENVSIEQAADLAADTVRRSGATIESAIEARRAVHSLLGQGAIDAGIQNVIAGSLARFGGTAQEAEALTALLQKVPGATDSPQAALQAVGVLETIMKGSRYATLGEIAGSVQHGALTPLIWGMPLATAGAYQAAAYTVSRSPLAASQLMQQVGRIIHDEKGQAVIGQELGLGQEQVVGLPEEKKWAAFSAAIRRRGPEELNEIFTAEAFPGRSRDFALRLFKAPAAIQAFNETLAAAQAADAATVEARNEEFMATSVGRANIARGLGEMRGGARNRYDVWRGELSQRARGRMKTMEESGEIGWFARKMTPEDLALTQIEAAIQLEYMGIKPEGTYREQRDRGSPMFVKRAPGWSWVEQLQRAKRERSMPSEALVDPSGEAVMPTTVNNYGPQYHLVQPAAMSRPAPGGPDIELE